MLISETATEGNVFSNNSIAPLPMMLFQPYTILNPRKDLTPPITLLGRSSDRTQIADFLEKTLLQEDTEDPSSPSNIPAWAAAGDEQQPGSGPAVVREAGVRIFGPASQEYAGRSRRAPPTTEK